MTVWYAIVRPDNGFPVLIYPEKERAELVASKNGYRVVPVSPVESKVTLNEPRRTVVLSAIPIKEQEQRRWPITPTCGES